MKKLLIVAILAFIIIKSGLAISTVMAEGTTEGQNPMANLVERIANKFNLNQDEVQAVVDEAHEEQRTKMQTQRLTELTEKLDQLVTDGKITKAQKQLILTKHAELQAQHEDRKDEMANLTAEERKNKFETERTALETWAKENGIDMEYVMLCDGKGMGGHGGPRGFGDLEVDDNTPPEQSTATQQ